MDSRFPDKFNLLLKHEGVYSDDPYDSGGKTIYGIARNFNKKAFDECYYLYKKNKDSAKLYAMDFYYKNYWNYLYSEIKDSSLLFRLFDFGVNAGVKTSVRLIQEAISKFKPIKIDGDFGRATLNLINELSPETYEGEQESKLFHEYVKLIENFYRTRKTAFRFLKGWLNRLSVVFNYKKIEKQYLPAYVLEQDIPPARPPELIT